MPLNLNEAVLFLERELNIRDQKLLADYREMTQWALGIGNNPSLIKTVPNPTGVGKPKPDLRFTLITETGTRKNNFLIFKFGGKLQLHIPKDRESALSRPEDRRINGNIIEFDVATATTIPLDDKIIMASLAYCLLIERHGLDTDSCLNVLKSNRASPSTETKTHRGCLQPTVADWDQTLALLSRDRRKVKFDDVLDKIQRDHNGDTLCPDWRKKLMEELKRRDESDRSG